MCTIQLVGGGQERAEERTALTPQRERIIQRKVNLIGECMLSENLHNYN